MVVALVVSLLAFVPAQAAPKPSAGPAVPDRSVAVGRVPVAKPAVAQSAQSVSPAPAEEPVWPEAGSVVADLSDGPVSVEVGGLPVRLSPPVVRGDVLSGRLLADLAETSDVPDQVRLEVAGREEASAAGAALLLRVAAVDEVAPSSGVRVEVDYSGFQEAYGAGWASRLRMAEMPECALLAVEDPECGGPAGLDASNDPVAGRIAVDVELSDGSASRARGASVAAVGGGTVVALLAGAAGETGSFSRTTLAASATWQAGQSGGGFSWAYPLSVPPAPGGLEPDVSFGYSSAAVDGRTNGENTQPSWLGEGWDYHPGYIERAYRTCSDDGDGFPPAHGAATPDPCYRESNAKLVWQGKSTEIVVSDTDGKWRLADDDGSRIELLTGQHGWSQNGEAWRLTTTDGTQFYFGRQRLPGWNTGDRETNSVMAQAVFANHTNEPCYSATSFYVSRCFMAYRWNLDYVVDAHGNSLSYWYAREMNRAGITGVGQYQVQYDRGSILERIEYGTRAGTEADTVTPPMQVLFGTSDRCLTSCWSGTTPVAANWPDTPWDIQCDAVPCNNNIGPSYFTTKRLTSVTTQVRVGGAYQDVDRWNLGHSFPTTTESTALNPPSLWLTGITHTGYDGAGGSQALPEVTFGGTRYANRTDYNVAAAVPVTNKYRVTQVNTETGGQIEVTYEGSDCTTTSQADPDNNSKRCFPQYYKPAGSPAGWSWWNKYRVTQVVERDLVGGSPAVTHAYAYSTAGASSTVLWHHNDADVWARSLPLRTWSDFRGWPTVTVTTGTTSGAQTQTKYLFFRGMDYDRTDAGHETRRVTITGSDGAVHGDYNWRAGIVHEETTYASPGGQALTRTIQNVWGAQTSARNENPIHAQPPNSQSVLAQVDTTDGYTWLTGSSTWRQTRSVDAWDATYGTLVSTDDQGDIANATDNTCTRYTYARNTGAPWLIDTVSRSEIVAKPCASAVSYPGDLLADERYYHDGSATWGATPTRGLVTRTEEVSAHSGTAPTYATTGTLTYDAHGRVLTSKDALNRTSTTEYTPTTGGPTTSVKVTNPLGQDATTNLDPRRGVPTTTSDLNDKVSTGQYDALGRLTKLWHAGRSTAGTPDEEYAYTVSKTAPSNVRSRVLGPNGNQIDAYEIFDGLLRPRQAQSTAPDGKRAITDTQYDNRGLSAKVSSLYNNASGPTGTLVSFADTDVHTQNRSTYDGPGRIVVDALWSDNVFKWQTSTSYGGDRTNIDPPDGGVATTTIDDARGRTTALRQYQGGAISGTYDETTYQYDLSDQLTTVTDPAGNDWIYEYDLRGRQVAKTDPDAGESTSTYDVAGQLLTTTDSRGETLARVYDGIGRVKEIRDDTTTGALRTSFVYDTLAAGQLTSSTRHVGAAAYVSAVTGYNDRYQPTGSTVTIPAAEGNLAGTYTSGSTYLANGAPATSTLPATGGLPAETLTYGYSQSGLATTMASASTTYVASTSHYWQGQLQEQLLGAAGKRVSLGYGLDEATRRLTGIRVKTENQTTPGTWVDRAGAGYSYDQTGNVTSIAGDTDGVGDQVECFRYDYQRRLTDAWSQASTGCTTPQRAGADPYRLAWTYDVTGNRKTQTSWSATGSTIATSSYPVAGGNQPHAVSQVAYTGQTTRTDSYVYDNAGNTTTRPVSGVNQTLTWDPEGHLATTSQTGQNTSYVYDAAGNRLLRRDSGGATLYLGGTELRLNGSGQVDGTRYYSHNGSTVAVRGVTGLTWLAADHHGTSQLTVDPSSLNVTRRRSLPFGEPRGTQPGGWPSDKGFVGGTQDPTGLTHLGAREYDPVTGRFISVDPVMDLADPQQWSAYAYANNTPVTASDPSGLKPECGGGTGSYSCSNSVPKANGQGKWNVAGSKSTQSNSSTGAKPKPPKAPGPVKPSGGSSAEDSAKAKKIMETSLVKVVIEAAGDVLLEFLGIPDIMGCLGGNLLSCAMALINILPPGKVLRAAFKSKALINQLKAVGTAAKKWGESTAWAKKVLGSCHSFAPGTKVVLAGGDTKSIEDLGEGDQVLATDPETGETRAREVTDTHINLDTDLADLTVTFGDGRTEVIKTTQHHPFWSQTRSSWIDAVDLQPDEQLLTLDQTPATITRNHSYIGSEVMYDLTVSTVHTYYVVVGDTPVLVHNTNTPIGCGPGGVPIYDIPAGSSGGPGAGRRIPPGMLENYNIGVNADPSLPTPLCSYCRANPATSVDHVEPRSRGGDLTDANTTPACTFCNSSKGARGEPVNPPPNYTGPFPPPWW
ncbi:polymorphic toxin-type HINT domain-containing protein [Micromonospora sp. NBC_01699]|uniref:polymorphic toxin-type HINT domain-containing protein n=1 Tax=Micromonospora sp. NBC_01699 TaxID=2975984 RepID=UPI002E280F46|nr:polymorphic toxin-type HINT domain-containing protein [Micromonospora sp. NBC_01699]